MYSSWRIEMLGDLRATNGETVVSRFRTHKAGVLLAYLAFHSRRNHNREELAEMLWPETEPEILLKRLRLALSTLRHQLEPPPMPTGSVLIATRSTLQINSQAVSTDVAEFEELVDRAVKCEDAKAKSSLLEGAIRLYKGDFLPGTYEEWALAERQRLADMHALALQSLVQLYDEIGQPEQAIPFANRAVMDNQLEEEHHCKLMHLYIESGQGSAAIRQYKELERILKEELGAKPSREARDLLAEAEKINLTSVASKLPSLQASTPAAPVARIPLTFTRFFGREAEIRKVDQLLCEERRTVVTLTGPGGAGKTRLSIQASRKIGPTYDGAIWFVSLAELADAEAIPEAIATSIQAKREGVATTLEAICRTLENHPRSLLILDNFEHLCEEGALHVRRLMEVLPNLQFLVSSRQRLGLEGEYEIPLKPLPFPQGVQLTPEDLMTYPSVQLFIDRAQALRPDFQLTRHNADALAELSEKLEGIPLAIELAAALCQAFSPAQMVKHLEKRFELLASRRKDIVSRHRTLRVTIDYSYDQLSPELQALFAGLSVFQGGWSLEAAEHVLEKGAQTLPMLLELRERSLITCEEFSGEGIRLRFNMLETLREYASERLDPSILEHLHRRHANFFTQLVDGHRTPLIGEKLGQWMVQFEEEHENICIAFERALAIGEDQLALKLVLASHRPWSLNRSKYESYGRLQRMYQLPSFKQQPLQLQARACLAMSETVHFAGRFEAAEKLLNESLDLSRKCGDRNLEATTLSNISTNRVYENKFEEAERLVRAGLAIRKELGDLNEQWHSISALGFILWRSGKVEEARDCMVEGLEVARKLSDIEIAMNLINVGNAEVELGKHDKAAHCLEEALFLSKRMHNRETQAWCLCVMAKLYRLQGQLNQSAYLLRDVWQVIKNLRDDKLVQTFVAELGLLSLAEGKPKEALCYLAHAGFSPFKDTTSFKGKEYLQALETCREVLNEDEYAQAWASGCSMTIEDIMPDDHRIPA